MSYTRDMANKDDITLAYSPRLSLVLAIFPDSGKVVVFDTRIQLEDNTYRAATWTSQMTTATYVRDDDELYAASSGLAGEHT